MHAQTPLIEAPRAAPISLKKIGSAISAAIDSTAFAVITIACAFIAYLEFLAFGDGAHGRIPDGAIIFVVWLVTTFCWVAEVDSRWYTEPTIIRRFDDDRIHRLARWWSKLKTSRRSHVALWPLLLTLFWSSTAMQYSAPGAGGVTSGSGEYIVRVNGTTLSAETPMIRALPWNREKVPLRWQNHSVSTRATSLDGIKFDVCLSADLALGNSDHWPWQSIGNAGYPKIDSALAESAKTVIGKMRAREIGRDTFALEIDTAMALNLDEAGMRPDGEISVSLKPYFDGSEVKLEAEKK